MMSLLPDLTPRDPHSLWYTSPRHPSPQPPPSQDHSHQNPSSQDPNGRRPAPPHLSERSQLARLRADEQYAEIRRLTAQDFGSRWLKPVGVVKTLHQMREEKREQEEHQEALRREALAQELAEAEAAGQGAEFLAEEDGVEDVMLDGAQDLDDDIPEGADMSMGFGSSDDDDDDDDEDEDEDGEGEEGGGRDDLVTAGMRRTGDAFREALARGHADPAEMYGGDEDLDEEGQGHMLDEEDFIQAESPAMLGEGEDDLDMDANLDDEIPEAELSGYEHTDSDAELSSSEEEEEEEEEDYSGLGMGRRVSALAPPRSPTLRSRARLDEPRLSMDLSSILSQDESGFMESSPAMRAPRRQ
ncbi:uncharacterized protein DNG_06071 [Cephalotrichum gorgonifer]|uniref:Apc15p domain-containing protein n=1 Tax=Cephalotrichum gorgonifer TaxID=2041049 RepID=A0AAE8SW72_9PEZI|nr:uncharacterized protein DNG_06071 [Cephalotrichum gorgonifer]